VIAGIEDSVGAVAGTFHVPGSLLVVLEQKGAATPAPTATRDRAAKPRERDIPKTGPIVIIPLDGMVGEGMRHSVERRLREAAALEPALLVFEMDTYGGILASALSIADSIFDLEKPHTIAFVNDKAISAGALISVACDEIIMTRGSEIGDCQVVSGGGEKVGSEKIDTVLRARFRTFCDGKYPLALSEAMVSQETEIYQVTTRDGATEFLTGEQWENLTAAERESYAPGSEKKILSDTRLLTMTDKEAAQYGFSTETVKGRSGLIDALGLSAREQVVLDWTWSELLVRWLDSVGPLFLTLGILGIIIELKTPGFGIPGIVGLCLIAVFFLGKNAAGLADAWEIMLFGIGVALLAVEVFLIPGFGFVGLAGLLCMAASVILALQPFTVPQSTADWSMFEVNVMSLGMVTLGVFIGALLIGRYLHKAPYLGKLVLASPPPSTSPTATSRSVLSMPTQQAADERASELVGRQGKAISLLRPAGRAEFDGEPMDVVTQGDFIQAGEPIEICEVHGNRVVVARRTSAES
ncbi:hypothetical protein HQ560_07530, partial [bacterium]|nr:hypothetical protein [bacterium]